MKKHRLKWTCLTLSILSAVTLLAAGCNKKLNVKFDYNADDYVKLGDYNGLKVDFDEKAIIDTHVNAKVQSDLDSKTTYHEVNRASTDKDKVTVNFVGKIGGQQVEGFSSSSDNSFILGKDSFLIPGFVDELSGVKAGESKVAILTVPQNFSEEPSYSGKKIVYDINVVKVEEPLVPQITDAYVKQNFSADTVADYKTDIQKNLQADIDSDVAAKKRSVVLTTLLKSSEVSEVPDAMLQAKRDTLNKSLGFYASMYGVSIDDYCQSRYGVSFDDFVKNSAEQDLILQAVVQKEKISVDEYYYKANLDAFAKENGGSDTDQFVQKYGKDYIVKYMVLQKATDFVIEHAVMS